MVGQPRRSIREVVLRVRRLEDLGREQDARRALQWLGKKALSDDRLVQPPADNAYYYCSRLLAMDPDNPVARQCFEDIAERFVILAEREFSNRDFVKAESPECRALLGLFRRLDPYVFMDLHTTNGSNHGYHLTYAPSLSTSSTRPVTGAPMKVPPSP